MLNIKSKVVLVVLLLLNFVGVGIVGYFSNVYLTNLENNRKMSINHPYNVRSALMEILYLESIHDHSDPNSVDSKKVHDKIENNLTILEERYQGDINDIIALRESLRSTDYVLTFDSLKHISTITESSNTNIQKLLQEFIYLIATYRASILYICLMVLLINTAIILFIYAYFRHAYKLEAKSRELVNLASTVFDNSKEGFMIIDHNHVVLLANRALEDLLEFKSECVTGKNLHDTPCVKRLSGFRDIWLSCTSGEDKKNWSGEILVYKSDNTVFSGYLSLDFVANNTGNYTSSLPKYIFRLFDISDRKKLEAEILYLAQYDELTGLPNRRFLSRYIQNLIGSYASAHSGNEPNGTVLNSFALLFIDTDKFKHINDTYGHVVGDSLLKQISDRLRASIRASDFCCRYGGDEFIVVLRDINKKMVKLIVDKIHSALSDEPYFLGPDFQQVCFSVGVCLFPEESITEDDIINKADDAMYHAKKNGGGNIIYWDDFKIQSPVYMLERELSTLVKERDFSPFYLVYQPQVDIQKNTVVGCEALLRWKKGDEIISPMVFIPIMEATNIILPVGNHVLRKACSDFSKIIHSHPGHSVGVNLSIKQLKQAELIAFIIGVLRENNFPQTLLELEITESIFTDDLENIISVLNGIKSTGINIAIDDFGVGYSSLSRLVHLPIDKIKIDAEFMRDLGTNESSRKITNSVVQIGKTLGMKVIAEGVETIEQLNYLKSIQCDQVQGYYFAKPMIYTDYVKWLSEWKEQKTND